MSRKAILSAVLGALSFGLLILTGVPAMLLGLYGLREIHASEGRLRGKRLAIAGMVMGAIGTLLCAFSLGVIMLTHIRGQASRSYCLNHLRQLGLALNQYHETQAAFPAGTVRNLDLPPDKRLSWLVTLLPYLEPPSPPAKPGERGPWERLFDQLDQRQAWDGPANREPVATRVHWFRCPSDDQRNQPGKPALTDYVGVAGVGPDAATLPATDPRAGCFGYDRRVERGQVTGGISNTLMAGETRLDNGPWAAGGPATVRPLDPATRPYIGWQRPFGGLHSGGANFLFVDASARFLRADIEPETLERLATIHADQ